MVKKPDLREDLDLRGLTVVIVKNAPKEVATANRTSAKGSCIWNRNLLIDALMWTGSIVVSDELLHHTAQVGLIDNQQLVQTLFARRTNPPFGVRIRIRPSARNTVSNASVKEESLS